MASSKDETAARKAVADNLKSLVTYYGKHIDSTLEDYIKKSTTSPANFNKSTVKTIQGDAQKRVDIYTKLTNEYLLKERYTDFTVKCLCEEESIRQCGKMLVAYVKYCDLLGGAAIYAEPSDEDETEEERKKQKAALSSDDRAKCALSRLMCYEGKLLIGLIASMLFINNKVGAAHASAVALAEAGGKASKEKRGSVSVAADDDDGDNLFATVTLDYTQKSIASATAALFVRALPDSRSLIGLLSCTSDPNTQLGTLRIIGALAEHDPIATIPFIAAAEGGISAIGAFIGKARVADHCGTHSNIMVSIQSAAATALCLLTDPVAIDAAQKADAAAFDSGSPLASGIDPASNVNTASTWLGMTGTLQRIIQGALAFDGTIDHLFTLATENNGAFAKDDIAAEIEETVCKTALAVPIDPNSNSPSPHPSVARGEGNLSLVRRAATVISNVLKNNHQTTGAFIQMGYLTKVSCFFYVPPPLAGQCGDDDLAPLPPFARNKGARAAPTLGIELLLPTACDIITQCLDTGAHDQQRLEASQAPEVEPTTTSNTPPASLGTSQSEVATSGVGGTQRNTPPPTPLLNKQTAASAQKCLDHIIHQSSIGKSILHYLSLIGSARSRWELLSVSGGTLVFRQLVVILQKLVTLLPGQARGCSEWLLRNDAIATSSPVTQELCSAYYAPALPHGKTAIGSIVEDVCLRAQQPRTDTTAVSLLSALIGQGGGRGGSSGPSFVEVIISTMAQCVAQPNAAPQPLSIRALACALLPQLGRTAAATGSTLNLMSFIGERFLTQLLDVPEQAQSSVPTNVPLPYADAILNPTSATAATLFCLSFVDAIARLEGTDGGCGLTADELSQAESSLLTKATDLCRKAFASGSSSTNMDRLLSWMLLASIAHHNFSTRVETRVYKAVKDILKTSVMRPRSDSQADGSGTPLLSEDEQDALGILIELLFRPASRKLLQSPERAVIERGVQQCVEVLNAFFEAASTRPVPSSSSAFPPLGHARTASTSSTSAAPLTPTQSQVVPPTAPFPLRALILSERSPFSSAMRTVTGSCATPGLGGGRRVSGAGAGLMLMGGGSQQRPGGGSVAGGSVANTINSAAGGFGAYLSDSSAGSFNIMRDVLLRFVQMQSHSGDDDDKSVRSEVELASQKVRNASLCDQLATKEKQHFEADAKIRTLSELSASLLIKRRRRIELLFPKFADDEEQGLSGFGREMAKAGGGAGSGWF